MRKEIRWGDGPDHVHDPELAVPQVELPPAQAPLEERLLRRDAAPHDAGTVVLAALVHRLAREVPLPLAAVRRGVVHHAVAVHVRVHGARAEVELADGRAVLDADNLDALLEVRQDGVRPRPRRARRGARRR